MAGPSPRVSEKSRQGARRAPGRLWGGRVSVGAAESAALAAALATALAAALAAGSAALAIAAAFAGADGLLDAVLVLTFPTLPPRSS
jgi:hypothetical protein